MRRTIPVLFLILTICVLSLMAQTASRQAGATAMQADANLNQLMQGVLYPPANVVFSAQTDDPGGAKPVPGTDPSMATDPLLSTFGGWKAVENAALALTESANLLLVPGRSCANGVPAPISDPDWSRFVQQLRDAGRKAYEAALARDQDRMVEIAETLSAACAGCHRKWRETRGADRCK
jgi:hypothetical protein